MCLQEHKVNVGNFPHRPATRGPANVSLANQQFFGVARGARARKIPVPRDKATEFARETGRGDEVDVEAWDFSSRIGPRGWEGVPVVDAVELTDGHLLKILSQARLHLQRELRNLAFFAGLAARAFEVKRMDYPQDIFLFAPGVGQPTTHRSDT